MQPPTSSMSTKDDASQRVNRNFKVNVMGPFSSSIRGMYMPPLTNIGEVGYFDHLDTPESIGGWEINLFFCWPKADYVGYHWPADLIWLGMHG